MEKIIPSPRDMLDAASKTIEIRKNFTETSKNISERKLADACRKLVENEFPDVVDHLKDALRTSTHLNEVRSRATDKCVDYYLQATNSTIQRNLTQERVAISKEITYKHLAGKLEDLGEGIGISAENMASSEETAARNVEAAAGSMKNVAESAESVSRNIEGIHVIGNSLVDRLDYYGRFMQLASTTFAYQAQKAINVLTDISEHLSDHNNILVSGGGGPDGFARHVYDFIQGSIDETTGEDHRFFVYHPDTNWYPSFHRLIREKRLPRTFCLKSDDLDKLCRYMQAIRDELKKEEGGAEVVFHLLIPSWCKISIKEPLHFPNDLQPFYVEGTKSKGKPFVEFNLPAAPDSLLKGVANVTDPKGWNNAAGIVADGTSLIGAGWGVNGFCLAIGLGAGAVTGLGVVLAIPIWVGTAMPTMGFASQAIYEAVHDTICEEPPRVLGSNDRL